MAQFRLTKKFAMATHAKSLLTFLLPYEQVGGAKFMTDCIGILLKEFLNENDLEFNEAQLDKLFSSQPIFCKTDNRKILGHTNDFKRCIEAMMSYDGLKFGDINWDEVTCSINNMPVGMHGYKYATELAIELFSR